MSRVVHRPATWAARCGRRTGGANQVYVQAATLTGDQVSDDAVLINAKLTRAHVPVPHEDLVDVGSHYARVRPESRAAALGVEGMLLRSAPLVGLPRETGHTPIRREVVGGP